MKEADATRPREVDALLGELGHRVRVARVRRHWSQDEFGRRLRVSRQTIARLEDGDPAVGVAIFLTAVYALGMMAQMRHILAPETDALGLRAELQRAPRLAKKKTQGRLSRPDPDQL